MRLISSLCRLDQYLFLRKAPIERKQFFADATIHHLFEEQRETVQRVLHEARYFHGTGRMHYANQGQSKYDGTTHQTENTFHALMTQGLVPMHDLLAESLSGGKTAETISLTRERMYAKLYASLMSPDRKSDPQFQFGSRAYWHTHFLGIMALRHVMDFSGRRKRCMQYVKGFLEGFRNPEEGRRNYQKWRQHRKQWQKQINAWTASFRKDGKYADTQGIKTLFLTMMHGRTDIPGNHGMIIGIAPEGVEALPLDHAAMSCFETRCAKTIPPQHFTHIEIPLRFVGARKEEMKQIDPSCTTPIVPMEFAEAIQMEQHLETLLQSNG